MFGSCGIGEIAISKVTLIRRQKYYPFPGSHPSYYEEQLALSNVKLLRGISFSASRDFAVIPHDRGLYRDWETDRKSTRLNSSHITRSRMPSSA